MTDAVQLQYRNPDFFDDIGFTISVLKLVPFSGVLAEGEPVLEGVVASVQAEYKAVYTDGENTFTADFSKEGAMKRRNQVPMLKASSYTNTQFTYLLNQK